ncbi:cell division ATP-binding protein FtsE [candidate division WOR-3 bacterium]|nr:cell division ATP-binding protein FtsE [candidate division WOR-3 bacterium]
MIEFKNVTKIFQKNWYAVREINLKIDKGEFVFLVGKSGAGQSTLLRLIYLDIFPDSGEVNVAGFSSHTIKKQEIPFLRRKIGVIFQDFKLLRDKNVYENVAFALEVTNTPRRKIKELVMNALADVGITHKKNSFPYQLSGGEQQKVAIARALVREPFILLADEPTGNIDPAGSEEIIEILKEINTSGTAVLMATHQMELIKKLPRRVVTIDEGRIVEDSDVFH